MTTEYHVKLIQDGDTQTLSIPHELNLSTSEVVIRQEAGKLIIEPYERKSLLKILANLEDLEVDIGDLDESLLPLHTFFFMYRTLVRLSLLNKLGLIKLDPAKLRM
jgi:antitoxin VapB